MVTKIELFLSANFSIKFILMYQKPLIPCHDHELSRIWKQSTNREKDGTNVHSNLGNILFIIRNKPPLYLQIKHNKTNHQVAVYYCTIFTAIKQSQRSSSHQHYTLLHLILFSTITFLNASPCLGNVGY